MTSDQKHLEALASPDPSGNSPQLLTEKRILSDLSREGRLTWIKSTLVRITKAIQESSIMCIAAMSRSNSLVKNLVQGKRTPVTNIAQSLKHFVRAPELDV